jgi:hypothetical protein
MGHIGRVSKVKIGPYAMSNVRTAFKDTSGANSDYGSAMVGMPFLQQFNITLNYFCDTFFYSRRSGLLGRHRRHESIATVASTIRNAAMETLRMAICGHRWP